MQQHATLMPDDHDHVRNGPSNVAPGGDFECRESATTGQSCSIRFACSSIRPSPVQSARVQTTHEYKRTSEQVCELTRRDLALNRNARLMTPFGAIQCTAVLCFCCCDNGAMRYYCLFQRSRCGCTVCRCCCWYFGGPICSGG